jgi:hypothetical protein
MQQLLLLMHELKLLIHKIMKELIDLEELEIVLNKDQ